LLYDEGDSIGLPLLCYFRGGLGVWARGGGKGSRRKKGGRRRQQCGVEVVEISARLSTVREIREEPSTRENWEPSTREISSCRFMPACLPSSQEISRSLQIQEKKANPQNGILRK